MYTSLLTRQLKRYLKEHPIPDEWKELLDAVNRSYQHYERDHVLGKQSLEISSDELHLLASELSDKEGRLRALLEAAFDGILVTNENNEIEICNPASKAFLGLNQSAELLGKNASALLGPSPFQDHPLYEINFTRPDASVIPLEIAVSEMSINKRKLKIYVLRDISSRKEAQQRENKLKDQLVTAARQAGMMQVATSVLHNVGNVLNSVNIAATTLKERFYSSELHNLPKIAELIEEHKKDLTHFMEHDPRGHHIPALLVAIGKWWKREYSKIDHELDLLMKNVQHIKNIIKVQQSMSGAMGIKEKVVINSLLDDLIAMNSKEFENSKIQIEKEYGETFEVTIDRGRLLQILVNLIRNAIEALENNETREKKITFRTRAQDHNTFVIEVVDNGSGIDRKNLAKIFSYGFTTKEGGHGFGLHASALIAKEMKAELRAVSPGLGLGSSFILTLQI